MHCQTSHRIPGASIAMRLEDSQRVSNYNWLTSISRTVGKADAKAEREFYPMRPRLGRCRTQERVAVFGIESTEEARGLKTLYGTRPLHGTLPHASPEVSLLISKAQLATTSNGCHELAAEFFVDISD